MKNELICVGNAIVDIVSKIDDNILSISNSDDDIINKIKKIIRSEFKSTFSKRPAVCVHINRV